MDWRPIPTPPIILKEILTGDQETIEIKSIKYTYSFVVLNNGLILFSIDFTEFSDDRRAVEDISMVSTAQTIAYKIKETSKHWHLADADNYQVTNFYINPCIINHDVTEIPSPEELKELLLNENLKTKFDEHAILYFKRKYNSIFDKMCKEIGVVDDNTKFFEDKISETFSTEVLTHINSKIRNISLIFSVPVLLISFQSVYKSSPILAVIFTLSITAIVAFNAIVVCRWKYIIEERVFFRIRVLKKAIMYFNHANVLSRIAWEKYSDNKSNSLYKPENDYNGVINISNLMIDGSIRKLQVYRLHVVLTISISTALVTIISLLIK